MIGDLAQAAPGQSITLTLADEVDVSRGDIICSADAAAGVADQFEATIVWMSDHPMLPGRSYWLKIGTKTVTATMGHPKYRLNVHTLEHLAAKKLDLNEIGVCNVAVDRPIAFDAYKDNRDTGGFILIDRLSNNTVGAGLLHFALRRSHNIHWQATDVDKQTRSAQKGQKPCVLWFTGLSGAGKSTIANLVEKKLLSRGLHTYLLDGDNVRHGLNRDLGFTEADRVENIRRIGEVARLMVDAGLIVIVSFISPFRSERRMARSLVEEGEFIEIFVDTPLGVAEERDPKGLYKKARLGELKNFTGIDSPYEQPEHAELRIDTTVNTPDRGPNWLSGFWRRGTQYNAGHAARPSTIVILVRALVRSHPGAGRHANQRAPDGSRYLAGKIASTLSPRPVRIPGDHARDSPGPGPSQRRDRWLPALADLRSFHRRARRVPGRPLPAGRSAAGRADGVRAVLAGVPAGRAGA